jgi:2-keto-4-pentenoate hydratase/2-oxohepta-3-ene-1,7-dioic acid hydratase in catechol pathway
MDTGSAQSAPGGPIRIYRTGQDSAGSLGRLLLDDGPDPGSRAQRGFVDLTDLLERRGKSANLADLFEIGWLDREHLQGALDEAEDSGGMRRVQVECVDGVPVDTGLPLLPSEVGKILCLGKNFRAHAEEFGEEVPAEPLFFNKLPETLVPHGAQVCVPDWYQDRFDHEAEVAVVIGCGGRDISTAEAMDHVAGYTVANDLTARTMQGADRKIGHPWLRAKNMEGACPLGPAFVPRDCLDVNALDVTCHVNGELRQKASTADWVVGLPQAIATLSRHLTLHPGDVILMGTPSGVGPLLDGDEVLCTVSGIGTLRTSIQRTPPIRATP